MLEAQKESSGLKSLVSAALTSVSMLVQESLGHPAHLRALFERMPKVSGSIQATRDIALSSVPRWSEWGQEFDFCTWPRRRPGELIGWRQDGSGTYSSFIVVSDPFKNIGYCETTAAWECDIQEVVGFGASKSDLRAFHSLDQMVETNSREMITPLTLGKLQSNLDWDEIRLLSCTPSPDFFVRHGWDGRIFLSNSGGSHHFAAARYIANKLEVPVRLPGLLKTFVLNPIAVRSLIREFRLFVLVDDLAVSNGVHDALKMHKATYLTLKLPRPITGQIVILLPKNEKRSMSAAVVFDSHEVFDLGAHLETLIARQASILQS